MDTRTHSGSGGYLLRDYLLERIVSSRTNYLVDPAELVVGSNRTSSSPDLRPARHPKSRTPGCGCFATPPAVLALCALSAFATVACVGTTGGEIVDFEAGAAGPKDAVAGEPLEFTTDRGFDVELTRATLHVGAMYLDQSFPVSGAQSTSCILPGTYVAEVTEGADVDLLDPAPVRFPVGGHGTTFAARAGQVWLTHDDVNATVDPSDDPVLAVEGTATVDGEQRAFSADVTISSNRQTASALAGASPICRQRIVSPIPTDVSVQTEGALLLRIDPRRLFVNVDFAALGESGGVYTFSDDPTSPDYGQPSVNLYANLHAGGSLYTFTWVPHL